MKIGIVSDSHGDLEALQKSLFFLKETENVEHLFHLGDNASDTVFMQHIIPSIFKVPGTRETGYEDPAIRTLNISLEGISFSLSHVIDEKAPGVDVVVYGHTHVPRAYLENDILYVNPGHVINNTMRYPFPTFAVLDLIRSSIIVRFYTLNLELLEEKEFLL